MDVTQSQPLGRSFRFSRITVSSVTRSAIVVAFVLLFCFSAIDKLANLGGFYGAVRQYAVVPQAIAPMLTTFIPMLELWVAVGLAVAAWRKYAVMALMALLGAFALALSVNYLFGIAAPCGCMFSIMLSEATIPHIAFDLLLALLAATLLFVDRPVTGKPLVRARSGPG